MSERNEFIPSGSSDSFTPFPAADASSETPRGLREGLPPAFRMRADAHYVEQLDGTTPSVSVQYIAVHAIDVSDALADAQPSLVDSIKRHGVIEPLVVQRNNGTYKTITGQRRLAAARAAGLRDVPCLVQHVSDERAEALRELLRPAGSPPPPTATDPSSGGTGTAAVSPRPVSVLDVATAAMRLIAAMPEGQVSVVKTPDGARLSIDLPFEI